MSIAVRKRSNEVTPLPALPSLVVAESVDAALLARCLKRSVSDVMQRFADGHRAYVAFLEGEPAASGWVATRKANIGELKTSFTIPARHRYLWNFVTLPAHRGRGIYPRLIDAIVQAESDADVFWIAYAPENRASQSGIAKAGFTTVAALSFDMDGSAAVGGVRDANGRDAARLLRLPIASADLAPCWKCVRAGRGAMACPAGTCRCDYQRPEIACAEPARVTGVMAPAGTNA